MLSRSSAGFSTDTASAGACHDFGVTHVSRHLSLGLDGTALPQKSSLHLPRRLSFARWQDIGMQLAVIVDTTGWWLGDWLIYGQDNYEGRYKEAIERTSLDYQTLRNYAWVARAFSVSRRRDTLSFAHHAEVAGLSDPEQDFWLRTAANSRWSRNRLRAEVKTSLNGRQDKIPLNEPDDPAGHRDGGNGHLPPSQILALHISSEQLQRFERAADVQNGSLEEWAIVILDQVARKC